MIWEQKKFDPKKRDALVAEGIKPVFATLLSNRAATISCKRDIPDFVGSPLSRQAAPESVPGAAAAIDLLSALRPKRAAVFGDYDVDGICSSYMAKMLLREFGCEETHVFIPDRVRHGYGLNTESIRDFLMGIEDDPDLVVALDCGSSSRSEIGVIRRRFPKAKVLVVDHHLIEEGCYADNADVVVSPRLGDCEQFCTGALVYQLARLGVPERQAAFLPYACLATVADVCELTGSNRIIVRNGLLQLQACEDLGLRELLATAEIRAEACKSEDLAFRIAPMINAAGRLHTAELAFRLLETKTRVQAMTLADELRGLNEMRKEIQNRMIEEALKLAEAGGTTNGMLLYSKDWHIGVVGIVAGQVADRLCVPTCCFGLSHGRICGSARSVEGVNIKAVMDTCRGLFVRYGGHEQAAGAELRQDRLADAPVEFDRAVAKYAEGKDTGLHKLYYDVEMRGGMLAKVDAGFCRRLDSLEPFGAGNERPLFLSRSLRCKSVSEWKSGKGGFVRFEGIDMTSYAMTPDPKAKMEGKRIDILFSIEPNFTGDSPYAFRVRHARAAGAN